MMKRP